MFLLLYLYKTPQLTCASSQNSELPGKILTRQNIRQLFKLRTPTCDSLSETTALVHSIQLTTAQLVTVVHNSSFTVSDSSHDLHKTIMSGRGSISRQELFFLECSIFLLGMNRAFHLARPEHSWPAEASSISDFQNPCKYFCLYQGVFSVLPLARHAPPVGLSTLHADPSRLQNPYKTFDIFHGIFHALHSIKADHTCRSSYAPCRPAVASGNIMHITPLRHEIIIYDSGIN